MSKIHIIPSEFNQSLELQLAYSIKAGFPSPAEDYQHETLDFNRDLIKHPEATFYGRVDGDSMIDAGINDGDIAIIDRSAEAEDGDVIVAFVNNEFTIKFLDLTHKAEGYIELRKTSWGACITVGKVNIPIEDESDLKSVLLALKKIYTDFVKDETPMKLVDMHIENLYLSTESSEEVKSAHLTAA